MEGLEPRGLERGLEHKLVPPTKQCAANQAVCCHCKSGITITGQCQRPVFGRYKVAVPLWRVLLVDEACAVGQDNDTAALDEQIVAIATVLGAVEADFEKERGRAFESWKKSQKKVIFVVVLRSDSLWTYRRPRDRDIGLGIPTLCQR